MLEQPQTQTPINQEDWLAEPPNHEGTSDQRGGGLTIPQGQFALTDNGWSNTTSTEQLAVEASKQQLSKKEINTKIKELHNSFTVAQKESKTVSESERPVFLKKLAKLEKDVVVFCTPLFTDDRFTTDKDKEMLGRLSTFIGNVNAFVESQQPKEQQEQDVVPSYTLDNQLNIEDNSKPGFLARLCCCGIFSSKGNKQVNNINMSDAVDYVPLPGHGQPSK